jgi:diguanylate cyclase (GGDEF)-like protein/PAS domain S-box-containing protein
MMEDKSRTKQGLIDELAVLRRQVATGEKSDDQRKSPSLLSAIIEATADGILVVDRKRNISIYNRKFLSLWRIPETIASEADDHQFLACALDQLKDPDAFLKKVEQLYEQPEAESFDTIYFTDGRVFERYSQPHKINEEIIGRVWSFRDVSELKRVEEEQHRNREIAERMVKEMAGIAEIGRLIGSTLDINEVYEKFAAEARKLIAFDRLSISLNNPDQDTYTTAYIFGLDLPVYRPGTSFPIRGSISEQLVRTRTGLLYLHPAGSQEPTGQYFGHIEPALRMGIQSFMSVPLISRDEVIGALNFRSKKQNAYDEQDLRLAERIGEQIAGAIANAQLFAGVKRAETSLRESEGRFRALIEQAAVGVAEMETETGHYLTVNRRLCEMVGRTEEEMLATTFQSITHPDDLHLHDSSQALLVTGKIANYTQEKRYIRKDGEIIWVSIATSPLWRPGEPPCRNIVVVQDISERKRMEEEQRRNQAIVERLANEMSVVSEIGRLVGSTLEINEVYERFAVETRKLISFDRLSITLNSPDQNTYTVAYVFGENVHSLSPGTSFPLQGSMSEALMRTRAGLLYLHQAGVKELMGPYTRRLANTFRMGMRSFISVPLISRDEMIGGFHFHSKKFNAYDGEDLRLAERIGEHIAGAIANAQLFADLKRTENSLRESERRFRALVEQAAVGVAEQEIVTGRYFTVNRRFCEMVGRTEEEMLAATLRTITHPDDIHLHDLSQALLLAGKIKNFTQEKRYIRKDGGIIWVNVTVSPLWTPGEEPTRNIIVIQDITERKRMEEEIREMSLRDGLTGLYNRRGFVTLAEQQIKAATRAKRPMQLAFIDVDNLKWINDNLGHEEGDNALVDTANILRQTFRESDIISRLGGDEFVILAIDAVDIHQKDFSRRLQQHIDAYNARKSRQYQLSMSWGTAIYSPESPISLDQLITSADQLMYAQKKAKSNKIT